jgi:hypothetical protein
MSELSPAAQSVFNAAWTCPIVLGDHSATRSRQIAAALRAVVQELKYFGITEKNILAIADELDDAANPCNREWVALTESPVQRGNRSGGPTTPKPAIIPKGQRPGTH